MYQPGGPIYEKLLRDLYKIELQAVRKLEASPSQEVHITNEIESILSKLLHQTLIPDLEQSFNNSFTSISELANKFSKGALEIDLTYKELIISISSTKENKLKVREIKLCKQVLLRSARTNRRMTENHGEHVIYFNSKRGLSKKQEYGGLFNQIILQAHLNIMNEVGEIVSNIYFLPASRSGLYQALSTFSAVIAELSKSRNFLTNKLQFPNISESVSDYFLNLSNISTIKKNSFYSEVVKEIESEILNGEIKFNKESKKIFFAPSQFDLELDLSVTSSMISEIAPIVAYLKYIISDEESRKSFYFPYPPRKNERRQANLIFIEEPEAHLHPSIQIKLMEFFAQLIKMNVKIVMTTHSNYMFNKLGNLILDSKIAHEKIASYLMKMTPEGSFADESLMRTGNEGMLDENFSDVAASLYKERIELYNKINERNVTKST